MRKSLQADNKQGFTLVELLVVIAVIALLMAILLPALTKAREQGKRAVCLAQIKQLQMAWGMYADNNKDKIVCSDIRYSWGFTAAVGGPQGTWCEWPHEWHPCPLKTSTTGLAGATWLNADAPREDWFHAIEDGLLWKYIEDHKMYRCPNGEKDAYVTYAIVHSMNAWPGSFGGGPATRITMRTQIKRTADRVVFIDKGYIDNGAFGILYGSGPPNWSPNVQYMTGNAENRGFFDNPPVRHGTGTVLSFVDNHAEYWKWPDPRTREYDYNNPLDPDQTGNQDKYRLQKGVWGQLGYKPAETPEY